MIARFLGRQLQRLSQQYPVITLTGPRQAGKTVLCKQTFPAYEYVNLEDLDTRQQAIADPRGFLKQVTKRRVILDEIQRTPNLPSYIQGIVDDKQQPGQFILTGSQQFTVTNQVNQSLAGRTAVSTLLPLALAELYKQPQVPPIANLLYTGFYPRIHDKKLNPTEALSFYLTTYIERDLKQLIHIKDLTTFETFLKLCASQVGQLINYSRLANDCGIDQKTVKSWLSLLEASYIIYQLQPHYKNFRKRLTKSRKLYFYDVGLASYLLGIFNQKQIEQHPLKGHLFENLIVSEFIKNAYNQVKSPNIYFFRDHTGNEIDLILDYSNTLVSVEIKIGETINPNFFKGLNYYHQLSKPFNTQQILIYGGNKRLQWHGIKVFPYHDLNEVFKTL